MERDIRIVEFQDTPVRLIRIDGVNYIPAEDLGKILGLAEPRIAVNKIFNRHREELEPHAAVTNLVTPGGTQETRLFTEIGAYLVAMFARTPRARKVRLWLAELPKKFRAARAWLAEEIDELIRRVTGAAFRLGTLTLNEETLERVYLRYALNVEPKEAARDLGLEKWKVKEAYHCLEILRVPKIQDKGKIPWTDETYRTRTAYGTSEEVIMNFVDAVEVELRKTIKEVLRISGGNYETFFKCFSKFAPCWCRVGKIRVILTKEVLKKAPPFLTLKDLANLLMWEYGPSTIKGKSFKTCYIEQRFFWERYVADLVQRMENDISTQIYQELPGKIVKH